MKTKCNKKKCNGSYQERIIKDEEDYTWFKCGKCDTMKSFKSIKDICYNKS